MSSVPSSPPQASLFQSLDSTPPSDSDSDTDPDLNKVNDSWPSLMLELDNLRLAAGGSGAKGKGKKTKGSGVVLETPEMRGVKDKIGKVEKEYMFSRKEGGMCRQIGMMSRSLKSL